MFENGAFIYSFLNRCIISMKQPFIHFFQHKNDWLINHINHLECLNNHLATSQQTSGTPVQPPSTTPMVFNNHLSYHHNHLLTPKQPWNTIACVLIPGGKLGAPHQNISQRLWCGYSFSLKGLTTEKTFF